MLLRGDAKGMCGLRDFLRQLRTVGAPLTLTGLCEAADAKKIIAVPVTDRSGSGMYVRKDRLEWRLDPTAAEEFAEMVDALTNVGDGHHYLECPGDEVGVMVAGSFTVRAWFEFTGEPSFVGVVAVDGEIAV